MDSNSIGLSNTMSDEWKPSTPPIAAAFKPDFRVKLPKIQYVVVERDQKAIICDFSQPPHFEFDSS